MTTTRLLVLVSSCLLCLGTVYCQVDLPEPWSSDKYKEEAAQTFNLVFHKYNPRVRPPLERIEVITVITLRHIRHLDLRKQELQTVLDVETPPRRPYLRAPVALTPIPAPPVALTEASLSQSWNDSRLQWYPARVLYINANTSTVWTPDIVLTNSVVDTKVLYPSSVKINHRGFVSWTRKELVTTFCATQPDTANQNCTINLAFMSNSRNDQADRFFSNVSKFGTSNNFTNHEWNVVYTGLILEYVDNATERANTVELQISLDRRSKVTDDPDVSMGGNQKGDDASLTSSNCGEKDDLDRAGNAGTLLGRLYVTSWLLSAVASQLFWLLLLR